MLVISHTTMKLYTGVILDNEVGYIVDLTFFELVIKQVRKFRIDKCVNARTLHEQIMSSESSIHIYKQM